MLKVCAASGLLHRRQLNQVSAQQEDGLSCGTKTVGNEAYCWSSKQEAEKSTYDEALCRQSESVLEACQLQSACVRLGP